MLGYRSVETRWCRSGFGRSVEERSWKLHLTTFSYCNTRMFVITRCDVLGYSLAAILTCKDMS